jgi:heme/copper-type cytochrome/quinol oxidase subunit 2
VSRRPTAGTVLVALVGFVGFVVLAGCAGTDPDAARSGGVPTSRPEPSSAPSAAEEVPTRGAGQRIDVRATGGAVTGDTGRVPVAVGTAVTLVVTSDAADEVHVHGYDLQRELVPGTPAELAFDATLPGVFEVELHETETVLLTLQVQ